MEEGIAIIGIACRFPGADNVEEFWSNLADGVESISRIPDSLLTASGVSAETINHPNYVKAKGIITNTEKFDADFFDITPKEAALLDPQQRQFLEYAFIALENAGYDPGSHPGYIGVYAGCGLNTYFLNNIVQNNNVLKNSSASKYQLMITNGTDFLASRVSYKLNLKGPSVSVQTACSTSLVAVHMACQGLLNHDCDMALAGGVTLSYPMHLGYLYEKGMIFSPDGHNRAFDDHAEGTVPSNGLGIVVLKRIREAIADGDHIYAVIRGSAVNNDGNDKAGYTAPGLRGQAEVITLAQAVANVEPDTITYIETHGTATSVGDPIEIEALNQAFRARTAKKNFCAIGSVKNNIGHTDTAAGIAGLIKTALALKHRKIPPTLHFVTPNPHIDFANSPFYVNTTLTEWHTEALPLRAGVSSFGIGGANAHVILEEAPILEKIEMPIRPHQLWVFSAKTASALEIKLRDFLIYLSSIPTEQHTADHMADIAYTLALGRQAFSYRAAIICQTMDEAKQNLLLAIQGDSIAASIEKNLSPDVLLEVKQSWLSGKQINWENFYKYEKRRRIPLPTYPFERQCHWLKSEVIEVKKPVENWFYIPSWRQSQLFLLIKDPIQKNIAGILVFLDALGLGLQIVNSLRQRGDQVIIVHQGESFLHHDEFTFTLNPQKGEDYQSLFLNLAQNGKTPTLIIHCWSLTSSDAKTTEFLNAQTFRAGQHLGCYSVTYALQAIIKQFPVDQNTRLLVVTNHLHKILAEDIIMAEKATLWGPCQSIKLEYPMIHCQCIDTVVPAGGCFQKKLVVEQLLQEIDQPSSDYQIAYRGNQRWVYDISPVLLPKLGENATQLREQGVYLIIGGLGKIGLLIAEYLARVVKAKLILVGRSDFPERKYWENLLKTHPKGEVSEKIQALLAIELTGAELLIVKADIGDLAQTQHIFKKIYGRFGVLNGIIHSAASLDLSAMPSINTIRPDTFEDHFKSKVYGTLHLATLLSQQVEEVDFCLLMSSLSSLLGSSAAYAAANAFMDTFSFLQRDKKKTSWVSVNWDGWALNHSGLIHEGNSFRHQLWIDAEEGMTALQKLLSYQLGSQVFVSTHNLHDRIKKSLPQQNKNILIKKLSAPVKKHQCISSQAFVAPNNLMEHELVSIWQNHLGINKISMSDNFFDIGGDSLVAVQLISEIRTKFQVPLSPHDLLQKPTITSLARHIRESKKPVIVPAVFDSAWVKIEGLENIPKIGPVVIAGNHSFWLDNIITIPFLLKCIEHIDASPYNIAASSIKFLSLLNKGSLQQIYLKRNLSECDYHALNLAINHLRSGKVVILRPEGKQNRGKLLQGKNGVAYIATQAKAVILPMAIYRSPFNIKEPDKRKLYWVIKFGPAFDTSHSTTDQLELIATTEKTMRAIAAMLPEKMRGFYSTLPGAN